MLIIKLNMIKFNLANNIKYRNLSDKDKHLLDLYIKIFYVFLMNFQSIDIKKMKSK